MQIRSATGDRGNFQSGGELPCPGWLVFPLLLISLGGFATAGELPLWEAGAGVFPSTYPAYRGSDDQQYYLLPFPYLVYRGAILKVDREGLRARLFDSDRMEINISMNGAIPVKSDNDNARKGMPDLDPAFEIGPSVNLTLARPSPRQTLKLKFPLRTVIATDFRNASREGWIFNPHFNLDNSGVPGGWDTGFSLGPLFATRKYHAYYYEVEPRYATPKRPAYDASGGYSGTTAVVSISRRFENVWLGGFLRYDYLSGAGFDDSPLVDTNHSIMGGVAVAWIFARSKRIVAR
jgi:outer membrane scaffolding protein for murein synthesis (MipA/OmpV family)